MPETRVANCVIGLTTFQNKVVMAPLQVEDYTKSERVVEDQDGQPVHEDLVALTAGMFGLWSGKIDTEDGATIQVAAPAAFRREFTEETTTESLPGIVLDPSQLCSPPVYAGKAEQIRHPIGKVLFWAYALPLVEFTWEQMNQLAKRQKPGQELWELAIDQAADQLQQNWQQIRPTSRFAVQALLAQSTHSPSIWQVPKQVSSAQLPGFNQA
jgi:hypothetical protein